ncbi:MAG: hypothetical protein ACOCVF_01450 [bacterium]
MAKKGRPPQKTKEEKIDKDTLAKQKVDELLKDVPLPKKDKEKLASKLEEQQEKRTTKWLEDQLDVLQKENDQLKKEAEIAKEDYKKLYNQFQNKTDNSPKSLVVDDSQLKNKILSLFQKFERQYLGVNPERTQYQFIKMTTPSNSGLLDEFLKAFPFIAEAKKKKKENKKPSVTQYNR